MREYFLVQEEKFLIISKAKYFQQKILIKTQHLNEYVNQYLNLDLDQPRPDQPKNERRTLHLNFKKIFRIKLQMIKQIINTEIFNEYFKYQNLTFLLKALYKVDKTKTIN